MSDNFFKIRNGISAGNLAADPSNGVNGDFYYNTTLNQFRSYVNGVWGPMGSAGNADENLETLKNQMLDSPYQLLTPNIFSSDAATKLDGSSTGAYNGGTKTFNFSGIGQTMVSIQMLDATEFLALALDVPQVDLSVLWTPGFIDTGATYQLSRDGGVSYQTVTMARVGQATNAYYGNYTFTEEVGSELGLSNATVNTTFSLNATTQQNAAQKIAPSSTTVTTNVTLLTDKAGSPSGNFKIRFVKDNAGVPSTSSSDIIAESSYIPVSSVPSGSSSINVAIPRTVTAAGTYHLVVITDAQYQAGYSVGTTDLRLRVDGTTGTGFSTYNGTSWSNSASKTMGFSIFGHSLDLRVKITSSLSSAKLDGYGVFYNIQANVAGGTKKIERRDFNAVADNTSTFTLGWSPDPDLLRVEYVQSGQTFVYPSFSLSGNVVTFPANTFNNGGIESPVTLWFKQVDGTSFNNSDSNAGLLAANHLGSPSGTDYSSVGRGIYLRRPDGTLREIALDNNDDIVIISVP